MKVLFAVSNEEISETIVKKYQKDYKEIISHKNVYYFNAIQKEIQKDKSYDRIVISEELETFTNSQYGEIDKFIFDKLDSISDEATSSKGTDVPIILICSDRRNKGDAMLTKLFGIGVYDALIGKERSIDEICRLIKNPKLKKDAKRYYGIDSIDVNYQAENENDVSETEIQNILSHYRSLGSNIDRYSDSFNNIADQYNETQLRIITKFLPQNVREVLEQRCEKYQQVMSFKSAVSNNLRKIETKNATVETLLKTDNTKPTKRNVIIPKNVKKAGESKFIEEEEEPKKVSVPKVVKSVSKEIKNEKEEVKKEEIKEEELQPLEQVDEQKTEEEVVVQKRRRGRPRKAQAVEIPKIEDVKKVEEVEDVEDVEDVIDILPGLDNTDYEQIENILPGLSNKEEDKDVIMPGFDTIESQEEEEDTNEQDVILPGFFDEQSDITENKTVIDNDFENSINNVYSTQIQSDMEDISQTIEYKAMLKRQEEENVYKNYVQVKDISTLFTSDKKVATFIGTTKNGTSFCINNVAEVLSARGVKVAILDTTKNRNSYYIYTNNDESLRQMAEKSISGLANGVANGVRVNHNLSIYTSLPEDIEDIGRVDEILETLLINYDVILIDADFQTPYGYFMQTNDIYLVQNYDILTIQPLTTFLHELDDRKMLDQSKLKVILNKVVRLRGIGEKTILGGLSCYKDPAMSVMVELFDRSKVDYITIPFDEDVYVKYLEGIINCDVNLKGYSKGFVQILNQLANMIYPKMNSIRTNNNKGAYNPPSVPKQTSQTFSPNMNNTLDKMKNNF